MRGTRPDNGAMYDSNTDSRRTVLIGSSDRQLRAMLAWKIAADPCLEVVAQVTDGDSAVCCPVDFDIALIDISIGGLGILGVIAGLRRDRPETMIVVITHTDAVYLRHALTAEGADDYLVMPADFEAMTGRLNEATLALTARTSHQGPPA